MTPARPLRLFLIAGEASGDLIGARLMAALREAWPAPIQFVGVGGPRMAAEGLDILFPFDVLAVFGLAELVPRLPALIRRLGQTVRAVIEWAPDALITIDAPGFNYRVAARVRRNRPAGDCYPLIHYVAPTVWAWRPQRALKTAAIFDHLLTLLPFEPPYFERVGLGCTFVGHPILEGGADRGEAHRFRLEHPELAASRLVAMLPGSRVGEVRRLLPAFRATFERLSERRSDLVAVIPTVAHVADEVAAGVADWPVPTLLLHRDREKYDAFAAAEVALAASGTVALELALAKLPAVIAYRLHPLTVAVYRRLIRVKYANLVNLMHDRLVVPELLQENCRPSLLAEAVGRLLDDPEAREQQRAALTEVKGWLGAGGCLPSRRAAAVVLDQIAGRAADAPS